MNVTRVLALSAFAAVFSTSTLQAALVPIAPGGSANITAATITTADFVGAAKATATTPFNFTDAGAGVTLVGTLYAAVYQNTGGTLDFLYQIYLDPASDPDGEAITRLSATNFTGFSTAFGYVQQADDPFGIFINSSQIASFGERSGGVGNTVRFSFPDSSAGNVDQGEASAVLVVRTNATSYKTGFTSIINGTTVNGLHSFAPVPEPSTYALALGLLGAVTYITKRRRIA